MITAADVAVVCSVEGSVGLPGQVAERVVVDVGHQAERKGLLRVVQEDGVLGRHSEHHAVRQLEQVGQGTDGAICGGESGGMMSTSRSNR